MHILIAPNAFKNSLDATKAAEAISNGLQQSKLNCTTTCFPVADGGDGTASLLVERLQGKRIPVPVHDPLGRLITASLGLIDNEKTAVIELADASGLRLLKSNEYDPLHTTTVGTGELIREALNRNVTRIIICIGGSATVDGGTGLLRSLGVQFLDKEAKEIESLPASLSLLSSINTEGLDKRALHTEFIVLCDVENKLLDSEGAAAVFGPQKGASPKDVALLDAGLSQFRDIVLKEMNKDMGLLIHGGAAGGVAAALHAFLNAKLVNGIDYFLDKTGFDNELKKADLVITGEGSIDRQTLQGKGPFGVAKKAKERSLRVVGMAGKITDDKALFPYFDQLLCINEEGADLQTVLQNTYSNLEKTARLLGDSLFSS